MDDVVHRDHAHQPAGAVDDGGRNQRIFLEAQRHFLLVHVDRDQRLFALHEVAHRHVARAGQDPAELAGADRPMAFVDDEDFPEIPRQVAAVAQIVDHLADRHMFGHRDQVALH